MNENPFSSLFYQVSFNFLNLYFEILPMHTSFTYLQTLRHHMEMPHQKIYLIFRILCNCFSLLHLLHCCSKAIRKFFLSLIWLRVLERLKSYEDQPLYYFYLSFSRFSLNFNFSWIYCIHQTALYLQISQLFPSLWVNNYCLWN